MADFVINTDITTDTPTIEVTVNPDRPLPTGRHRFRLIVVDSAGRRSAPVEAVVTVSRVLTPIPDRPEIILTGTTTPVVLRPGRTPRKTKRSKPT